MGHGKDAARLLVQVLRDPHRLLRALADQKLGEQLDRALDQQQRREDGAEPTDADVRGDLDQRVQVLLLVEPLRVRGGLVDVGVSG